MSSTTTTSNLSSYPSDLKHSIMIFPLSSVRTVPRTEKPLSRRVRTTHMERYPLAPETRNLNPLSTEGIVFQTLSRFKWRCGSKSKSETVKHCLTRKWHLARSVILSHHSVRENHQANSRGVRSIVDRWLSKEVMPKALASRRGKQHVILLFHYLWPLCSTTHVLDANVAKADCCTL